MFIEQWITKNEERLDKLFTELVPPSGKCESLAGEIIRAVNRIDYRYFNDGDEIGTGYGKETCNPPARFLKTYCPAKVGELIEDMWGYSYGYEDNLEKLIGLVVDYVEANPQMREIPTKDMWDDEFRDEDEDVDDSDWDW